MNLVTVGTKKGRTRHYIDSDKYTRVSRSKALCGKNGKELIIFNAVYFNYKLVYPVACKKCEKIKNEKA